MKGIDISKHNGNINFEQVKKDGIDFVIIRAGYGKSISQKDPNFETYYKGAKSVGLQVGCYWYSYAMSENEAIEEAKAFLEVINGKYFELPVYFDFEERKQFNLPKYKINKIIMAFLDYVEKHNYWVGLYMSRWYLDNYVNDVIKDRYAIWIASYTKKLKYNNNFGIWQYSSKGRIKGIKGNVDLDMSFIDYKRYIISKKLNGYNKYKDTDTLLKEIFAGYWGNGEIRKRLLKEAGYNYTAVQALVNKKID